MKDEDFTDFDFAIFAVSPKYRDHYIMYTIEKVLKIPPEKYIAFHAVDSFENSKIVNDGISALFIKFERKAKIKVIYLLIYLIIFFSFCLFLSGIAED